MPKNRYLSEALHGKYQRFLLGGLESLSLPVFLVYIQLIETNSSRDWLGPYFLSTVIGLVSTAVLLHFHKPLNRIFIGIHLYFLSGLMSVAFGVAWLNHGYGVLGATGMLLWIVLVCAVVVICSGDLYGVQGKNTDDNRRFPKNYPHIGFVILAGLCAALSWVTRGNRIVSEVLPFIILFTAYGALRGKAEVSS